MQKIGITGSIGSGKSIVCKIFEQLGVPIYNADARAKILMVSNAETIEKVKLIFGDESYTETGELNRKHLSDIAFNNKDLLNQLNQIVHPILFKDFENWLLEKEQLNIKYIIKEAALMFETDSYKKLDKFIVVTAPMELRISRTMQRDSILKEQVLLRMNNQMSQEEKLAKADYEIINDEQTSLIEQVFSLYEQLNKKNNIIL
jgi:dephospho-CoA kinase